MDRETLVKIATDGIYKAHTEGLGPTDNWRLLSDTKMAEAVIDTFLDRGLSIQRFRAVGYFDHFGSFRPGCPPLTEEAGWTTALILVEEK